MIVASPIPTILISGYLGAGKTTLINQLLVNNEGLRITVLVNDFGKIAVDEQLIANQNGDTLALTNGCMCCSIGGALYDAIDRVLTANPKPDYLLIETSGVADPGKIAQIAIAEPEMRFVGCITLVDAMNFLALRNKKYIGDTVDRQVEKANVIGVTKSDIAEEEGLTTTASVIRKLNQQSDLISISQGRLPFRFLSELLESSFENAAITVAAEHSYGDIYHSWSFEGDATCTVENLENLSKPDHSGVYRLKGYVKAPEGEIFLINRAGDDFQYEEVVTGSNCTRLVAIGIGSEFDPRSFQALWNRAISNSNLVEADL